MLSDVSDDNDPITQQVSELVLTSSTSDYEVVATSKEEDQSSVVEYSTDGVVESDHEWSNASSNDEDNDVVVIEVEPGINDENGKNEEYVCCVIISIVHVNTHSHAHTNSTTHTFMYPLICIAHGLPCTAKNHQKMIVLKCVRYYIPCLHVYSLFYSHHGD